jgi:Tfp pilus assembly protein PilE
MKHRYQQRPAGYTVVEIMISVAVLMILSIFIFAGVSEMMINARLTTSANKILSTLSLARNLAISNNAIYHVRIQNFSTFTDGSGKASEYTEQAIGVYYFPHTNDALLASTQDRLTGDPTEAGYQWSDQSKYDPAKAKNARVEYVPLERDTFIGIQYPKSTSSMPTTDNILYFFPDGTASGNFQIFITNDPVLKDNPKRLSEPEKADWVEVNSTRYIAFYREKDPEEEKNNTQKKMNSRAGIQLIQVNKAGMVRFARGGEVKS